MALGVPALVSPVGMNTEVVESGGNGYVCDTPAQWHDSLRVLLASESEHIRQGTAARRIIVERYSATANTVNFICLFR